MAQNHRRIGPHSRLFARGSSAIDGRSREGRYLAAVRAQLVAHLGGSPSAPQRMIVDRLAVVALRLALFDEKIIAGSLTDNDARTYGALHNSFRLLIREIGLKAADARPSLAETFARRRQANQPDAPPPISAQVAPKIAKDGSTPP
jgi:hypothetical protein